MVKCQSRVRRNKALRLSNELNKFRPIFEEALIINTIDQYMKVIEQGKHLKFEICSHTKCKNNLKYLKEKKAILFGIQNALKQPIDIVIPAIQQLIQRANKINLQDDLITNAKQLSEKAKHIPEIVNTLVSVNNKKILLKEDKLKQILDLAHSMNLSFKV